MGGALPVEELRGIIERAGFAKVTILRDEVTDAYALKWGYGMGIKDYIERGNIYLEKAR